MCRSKGGKCCLSIFITLFAIIAILVIALIVLLNMTPAKLHIADKDIINGQSFNDMGLGDTKFIDMIKDLFNLTKDVKEEDMVKNGYNAEEEKTKADSNFAGSSITGEDYSSLLNSKVTYSKRGVQSYDDTTLAYIFNKMGVYEQFDLKEVTIGVKDGVGQLRLVGYIKLEGLDLKINAISTPSAVYVVANYTFSVSSVGKIVTDDGTIAVNDDPDSILSQLLVNLFMKDDDEEDGEGSVTAQIGQAFAGVIENLGQVGTATVDGEGNIGNIVYGIGGVAEHKITVVTYAAE